jgi:hypothetical protein
MHRLEYYQKTKNEVYNFCKTDSLAMSFQEIEEKQKRLHAQLESDLLQENERNLFLIMIDVHTERLKKGQSFQDFLQEELPAPKFRIGFAIIDLQPNEYALMAQIASENEISKQALAEKIFDFQSERQDFFFDHKGRLREIHLSYNSWELKPFVFRYLKLGWLKTLLITSYPDEVLDMSGLTYQVMETLDCSASNFVKQIILGGEPRKVQIEVCKQLEIIDFTQTNVTQLYSVAVTFSPKNVLVRCTETQYQYCEALKKLRAKKEIIPTNAEELDFYSKGIDYERDNDEKFLLWVVKHPLCDKGTALRIYWKANPEYFTQFAENEIDIEVNGGIYNLLKVIEKNIKKGFYKTAEIAFDPATIAVVRVLTNNFPTESHETFMDSSITLEPVRRKIIQPIPEYMFERVGK